MLIGHVQQGRPEWYDRTPLTIFSHNRNFHAQNAALVQVVTYTVPSFRKFFLQRGSVTLIVDIAFAPDGAAMATMSISNTPFLRCEVQTAPLGARDRDFVNGEAAFTAGQQLTSEQQGLAAAGAGEFVTIHILEGIEFDA